MDPRVFPRRTSATATATLGLVRRARGCLSPSGVPGRGPTAVLSLPNGFAFSCKRPPERSEEGRLSAAILSYAPPPRMNGGIASLTSPECGLRKLSHASRHRHARSRRSCLSSPAKTTGRYRYRACGSYSLTIENSASTLGRVMFRCLVPFARSRQTFISTRANSTSKSLLGIEEVCCTQSRRWRQFWKNAKAKSLRSDSRYVSPRAAAIKRLCQRRTRSS